MLLSEFEFSKNKGYNYITRLGVEPTIDYYHMLFDLMTALSLAMGSINKEDFQKGDNLNGESGPYDMQYSWILHMAEEIGYHLNELKNQVPVISRTIK